MQNDYRSRLPFLRAYATQQQRSPDDAYELGKRLGHGFLVAVLFKCFKLVIE